METEIRALLGRTFRTLPADGWALSPAGQAGSQRRFLRACQQGQSHIVMIWNAADPDWAFCLSIHHALIDQVGLMPRIHGVDEAHGLILEEDLGTRTLKTYVDQPEMSHHYAATVEALLRWQQARYAETPRLSSRAMDYPLLLWESGYFSEHLVAGHCGQEALLTAEWRAEREWLAGQVDAMPKVWMHRDFQSENILVHDGQIRFVDYQGARPGPAGYDLASLLYDPYVPVFGEWLVQELRASFAGAAGIDQAMIDLCGVQRLMQALGAYGKLARVDGKQHYLAYVPRALERLSGLAAQVPRLARLREITGICLGLARNHGG